MLHVILVALLGSPFVSIPIQAQAAQTDRDQVIAAVQGFFDSMATRDPQLAARVLTPEGRFYSTREQDGKPVVRSQTFEAFIAGLPKGTSKQLERMWDPEVKIHGPIATLWTRYDFHTDGKFSHCGIDAFDLVKTEEGWKLAGGTYTVESKCEPSPLGPLRP